MRAVFFAHNVAESTVLKRVRAFSDNGVQVTTVAFRRTSANVEFQPSWPNVHLGYTRDGAYLRRLLQLAAATWRIALNRRRVGEADAFYARNFDMCVLALFARLLAGRPIPVVYEVLDVHRLMTRQGPIFGMVRLAERWLLANIDLLVVSSPAFVEGYFKPVQGYAGRWFLLENKIYASAETAALGPRGLGPPLEDARPTWVIGWFGALRDRASLAIMAELARRLGDRVQIYVRGYLSSIPQGEFEQVLADNPNIEFGGEFKNPDDLPGMYAKVHFTWALDLFEDGANSTWLLSNRIYEGGLFGSLALAAEGSAVASKVASLDLGWIVAPDYADQISALLDRLTPDEYRRRRAEVLTLPQSEFVDLQDTGRLIQTIAEIGGSSVAAGAATPSPAS